MLLKIQKNVKAPKPHQVSQQWFGNNIRELELGDLWCSHWKMNLFNFSRRKVCGQKQNMICSGNIESGNPLSGGLCYRRHSGNVSYLNTCWGSTVPKKKSQRHFWNYFMFYIPITCSQENFYHVFVIIVHAF